MRHAPIEALHQAQIKFAHAADDAEGVRGTSAAAASAHKRERAAMRLETPKIICMAALVVALHFKSRFCSELKQS